MCGIVPVSTEFLMLQHCQDAVTFTQNITAFYYNYVGGVPQRAVLPHSPLHSGCDVSSSVGTLTLNGNGYMARWRLFTSPSVT